MCVCVCVKVEKVDGMVGCLCVYICTYPIMELLKEVEATEAGSADNEDLLAGPGGFHGGHLRVCVCVCVCVY